MIGLDDVPCSIEFTMLELAEISLAATHILLRIAGMKESDLPLHADPADAQRRLDVLSGVVRKIDDSIRALGLAEIEKSLGPKGLAAAKKIIDG